MTLISKSRSNDHGALLGLGDDDHPHYAVKANNDTISGDWSITGDFTYTGDQYTYSTTSTNTGNHNYVEITPTVQPSATHTGVFNGFKIAPSTNGGTRSIKTLQGAQILALHTIDYLCQNLYGLRAQITVGGVFSDGPGWVTNCIGGEFHAFHRSNSSTQSSNLEGGRFITDHRGTNNCLNVVTGRFQMKKSGTSTTTNYHGLVLDTSAFTSGTVTNCIGIEIQDITGPTITNAPTAINISAQSEANAVGVAFGSMTHMFQFPADATDPTSGGGAATGRIPVSIGGATRYLAYY